MSESNNNSSSGGIGFAGLLFIVFLVLKLTNVIDWSWWWVTAPLWAGLALVLVVLCGIIAITTLAGVLGAAFAAVVSFFKK